ncbi:MAG: single-stranded-DNA-specific exonuclease RecJ [Lachnospiraceae bacterium]|nr:single-stranded-DNA-specific exonuclease RecJ [Lachnospiraceae bacterium]
MTKERWTFKRPRTEEAQQIAERFNLDPVVAGILAGRGFTTEQEVQDFLYGGRELLLDPFLLKDMDRACAVLKQAIAEKKRIRIIGDYDIDGIMASYILKQGFRELGGDVDVRIPDRLKDGYGINENMIRAAHEEGIEVIVTCDNGISSGSAVSLAKSFGMTVVVTDHHEVLSLPEEADAIVDPKREDDTYPNKNLCGAAVAWKLILALGADREMKLLQFAGFATIGDIVDLTGENRALVKEALKDLRQTENPGLCSLAETCGVALSAISTYHIGFVLGPCLNASGRLDTAMLALRLLESESETEASRLAGELKALNDRRKAMTEAGTEEAVRQIESGSLVDDRVLVVFLPEIHESIAGIIAGRIRERYGRPTFILTRGEECIKGSGRSTEAYSMFEELVKVKELLLKFGGHPMATGLSLDEKMIPVFRQRLNELCTLTEEEMIPKICIDAIVPVSRLNERMVEELKLFEPCGKANPHPLFGQKSVICEHPRIFGARRNVLKMKVRTVVEGGTQGNTGIMLPPTEGIPVDAVCFRNIDEISRKISDTPVHSIIYEPEMNEYMGRRRLQIVISHFK